jgi:hypothetical protein
VQRKTYISHAAKVSLSILQVVYTSAHYHYALLLASSSTQKTVTSRLEGLLHLSLSITRNPTAISNSDQFRPVPTNPDQFRPITANTADRTKDDAACLQVLFLSWYELIVAHSHIVNTQHTLHHITLPLTHPTVASHHSYAQPHSPITKSLLYVR